MKKILNKTFLPAAAFLLLLIAFLTTNNPSFASVRCETQYGGNETCISTGELQIDKEIFDPENNYYVDNLGVESYRFGTAEEVTFKLKVKNVGDDTLHNIEVTDSLPGYLFFIGGSDGTYTIDSLSPDETVEILVYAQVKAASQLPADKSLVCILNTAEAKAGDEHDTDTAQLCLGKKVLGVSTLPQTGLNGLSVLFLTSVVTGLIGISLVRLSKAK